MKMTGGQYIVNYLKKEKVPYILGIPGHGVLGLFDAVRQSDEEGAVKYIQVKHEQSATHIADGYYRVAGKPLATLSSIGPGSLNTVIGLATAYVDSSAMVSFCGDVHTNMKGVGVLQEIERYQDGNFIKAMEPVTKRSWRVESNAQLARVMDGAFRNMKSGRPGPVAITVPMDIQSAAIDVVMPEKQFNVPEAHPMVDAKTVTKAVEIMKGAKRPVIVAGGGALKAKAAKELEAMAEKWGAAVVTTLQGKSAFPEEHPLYCYHGGSKGTPIGIEVCKKADVILALGVRFADETTSSYRYGATYSFPDTKLIHVDMCAEEIGKNYAADLGVVADLKQALIQFCEAYPQTEERAEYRKEIKELRAKWVAMLAERRSAQTENCTISQLLGEMNRVLPKNTIIATSSGNTQAQLFQEYCFAEPYTNLTTGGFSTMGWAFPAALGAKLAKPEAPVVALMGDGDFMMTMQEMATMAQYNIPVVVIVANNSGWFAIKDLQYDAYGPEYTFGNDWMKGDELYSPDFSAAAAAFGVRSSKISKLEEVAAALEKAIESGVPYLLEVDVCRDYPYTGGEAFGWWDMPVPAYMEERRATFEQGVSEEFRR